MPEAEDLLRDLTPRVLGALVRRYGNFATAEDAVQEALLVAATRWPVDGVPEDPSAWLVRVASRRLTDLLRSDQARRRREERVASWTVAAPGESGPPSDGGAPSGDEDDSLVLLLMCCHPALTPASQIALTLRAVGGLTTAEIARAFLVPEATMTRRISRAKTQVRDRGARFALPGPDELPGRLDAVLHVVYLVFREGYAATTGPALQRTELAAEAIRLARLVRRSVPDHAEAAGLLALLLLTHARRAARTDDVGRLVPMAEQDRSRWDAEMIAEGVALVALTLPRGPVGPYQVQAAIAALHDEARDADSTDWPQILALYEVLVEMEPSPVAALGHVVAVAMVDGPAAGLAQLDLAEAAGSLPQDHRPLAVRAHLLEQLGDLDAARSAYEVAAGRAMHPAQQRYLRARAAAAGVRSVT
ncbi:putative RNA polymerase, sigma-24 subunit, ECF subfamily [Beutenbergia cavernae DSM 12333]|uniref:Putative RNA polymerase, sigma-24 subunit, ECF subfamily n=1 Tax=Beutenbergia cavernae (strain ATCC BAA-8 / DSM 12333 / CCUG 43141 / JCM 11478 / NBRC 16432 / NCIMB 13614 / HKI 0122) TaxID=471853 RepID=C5BV73_BEUC1|nr:sigma-70 family RNA polymerase sigma factor [Beutenbergia cavernae]ACQ80460.1 putative RNA polymerase, sigma-24 subunit, ECF subfamily [Beutenbergia cavernae DSM 12333]